jgi:hypothetical protein
MGAGVDEEHPWDLVWPALESLARDPVSGGLL